ncbi:ester cyclase [Geodermatophilus sp. CPCC 206100]|uniref:ester cyclase n=1 Tax=Geodermatophilus sp. CPCC 206100 TaxID=3020054 RepID=UPI003AFFE4AD
MGQAREVMNGMTEAIVRGDDEALRALYAPDAIADRPDGPRLEGAPAIVEYLMGFRRGFPDLSWENGRQYESGDTAIDEGHLVGTHTETITSPEGELPATGRAIRVRECDIVTVRDGAAVEHRFYYDQLDLLTQLGLAGSGAEAAAVPGPRAATDQAPARSTR